MSRVPTANVALFAVVTACGAIADLLTKWLAFTKLGHPGKLVLWQDVFSFTTSYNEGALWGIGSNLPHPNLIFAGLSLVAAGAIVYWLFWHGAIADRLLSVALGLIMAGTIGNCYDRLVWKRVRDFLYFELIDWPIFNLADACLVCGAALLMIQALFAELPASAPVAAGNPPADAPAEAPKH